MPFCDDATRNPCTELPSVLYVAAALPVLSETFVTNEIRAMRKLGHPVSAVALAPHDGPCQPEDESLKRQTPLARDFDPIIALATAAASPMRLRSAYAFAQRQTALRPRSLLLQGARVARAARAARAVHIHAHFAHAPAAVAIVAARLTGATCSFTGHGFDVYGAPTDLSLKLREADFAIAVCADMRVDFFDLAPEASTSIVHCGVDPARFTPLPGSSNGRLLTIGRLVPQKGWEVLLRALGSIPELSRPRIDIVGGGPLQEHLRALCGELRLEGCVAFLGPQTANWIAAEGPSYQGFVAPYIIGPDGRRDTGPLTVKEAMAMGLPVLASSLMGLKEIVVPGCGRQVAPGNEGELAEGLQWLAQLSASERAAIGAAGRSEVLGRFTLRNQAEGLSSNILSARFRRDNLP